jgi:hypothetical protein
LVGGGVGVAGDVRTKTETTTDVVTDYVPTTVTRTRTRTITQTVTAPGPSVDHAATYDEDGDGCDDNYEGDCVPPDASDVDCSSGEGDGPEYVNGPLTVVGVGHYGLDRDGDGEACTNG